MKDKEKNIRLIIWLTAFAISYVVSYVLGVKLKEELKSLPSKEEDYLSNF